MSLMPPVTRVLANSGHYSISGRRRRVAPAARGALHTGTGPALSQADRVIPRRFVRPGGGLLPGIEFIGSKAHISNVTNADIERDCFKRLLQILLVITEDRIRKSYCGRFDRDISHRRQP